MEKENDFFENYDLLTDPDEWWIYASPPLKEQVEIVNKITQVLDINFPVCSNQYNKASYSWFIKRYAEEYKRKAHDWLEINDFISDVERLL